MCVCLCACVHVGGRVGGERDAPIEGPPSFCFGCVGQHATKSDSTLRKLHPRFDSIDRKRSRFTHLRTTKRGGRVHSASAHARVGSDEVLCALAVDSRLSCGFLGAREWTADSLRPRLESVGCGAISVELPV
jgi:hypothetical protein